MHHSRHSRHTIFIVSDRSSQPSASQREKTMSFSTRCASSGAILLQRPGVGMDRLRSKGAWAEAVHVPCLLPACRGQQGSQPCMLLPARSSRSCLVSQQHAVWRWEQHSRQPPPTCGRRPAAAGHAALCNPDLTPAPQWPCKKGGCTQCRLVPGTLASGWRAVGRHRGCCCCHGGRHPPSLTCSALRWPPRRSPAAGGRSRAWGSPACHTPPPPALRGQTGIAVC